LVGWLVAAAAAAAMHCRRRRHVGGIVSRATRALTAVTERADAAAAAPVRSPSLHACVRYILTD